MKLKPRDHIVMFVEKHDGIEEFFDGGWAQFICKATLCDYIFLVDEVKDPDSTKIIDGVLFKYSIYPTSIVTFKKVNDEDGKEFKEAKYYRASWLENGPLV